MAYVAVSAVVGVSLLVAPKDPVVQALPDYAYVSPQTGAPGTGATTTPGPSRVAMPVPAGYQRVMGPGGLVTTIPTGWTVTRSTGPGAMQATDPADPTRFVRYGGSPAPAVDLVRSHVDYERTFSASKPNFARKSLGTTRYHGVLAVDWEFQHDSSAGRRHVHSMYWRIDGIEYFLYATATTARWPETAPVYRTMIDNAAP